MLIHLVETLPSDVIVDLLKNILELIVSDHLRVVWDLYTLVVFLVGFGLLEILNLVIFLADVLIICFAALPRVSWVPSFLIAVLFGVSEGLVIGTNIRVS